MSINVGRGGATHDIALSRAFELGVDVLLIQEPLWNKRTKTTKSHPGYVCHIPYAGLDVRPRAATYTRKSDRVVSATQIFPCSMPTADYCWVVVNGITFFNVYKAPNDSTAIRPLVSWTPSPRCIAAGDFNSVHEAWQPNAASPHGQGEQIERWAETHNLSCLIIGEPTHKAGNTLDLAWTNISGVRAWVDRSECMTSDHLPLRGYVPVAKAAMKPELTKLRVPKENLPRYAQAISQWVHPPPLLDSSDEVEKYAKELCFHLTNAIKATGTRPKKGKGKAAAWWTPECKAVHAEYRAATDPAERRITKKNLRTTITAAKKEHKTRKIEGMTTPADVFKLMQTSSTRQASVPPPLMYKGKMITNQAERAEILRDELLARFQASDDLAAYTIQSNNRIPWNSEITVEEVRACTIDCENTAPGADGVSVELLVTSWNTIGPYVTELFQACIRFGTQPNCFKLAEVVLIQKPNRDPTTVKGWRPIALLSCLGKGLERLLSKRMAHLAVTFDVIGKQQFGAIPKRSATDLVSCVVHDNEEARTQGWAATFVTLDFQGAFDAVLHNRLIGRMQDQGWPDYIISWTRSFLSHRRVQVRYSGGVTSERELVCGVPQGSPISPLLFLLYMAEPMRSGNSLLRFSYADDVGILGFGPTIAESAIAAQREVDHLLEWSQRNAIAFDINKSEVVQFPGRRRETAVNININGTTIQPADQIRWLGVHLDPRLNFKHHVTTWCAKAMKVAHHMRRLNSNFRGAAPGPLVKTVESCITPVATYGADVWWPGIKRPTPRGIVTSSTTNLCKMIDKVNLMGLRAALPTMRTVSTVVIHREGGIPPARILLEGNRLRLAERLQLLDNCHPLRIRAAVCPNVGTQKYKKRCISSRRPELQMSRVQRAYRQLPEAEAAETLPPTTYYQGLGSERIKGDLCRRGKDGISNFEIYAYPDGSSQGHGRSSWGFVLKRNGRTFLKRSGVLHGGEVLDAEIVAARKALEAALRFVGEEQETTKLRGQRIYLLMDSQQAIRALETGVSSTSMEDVRLFRALMRQAEIRIEWVPGHSGIQGNEEADAVARAALKDLPGQEITPGRITLAYLRRLTDLRRQTLLDDWWDAACPPRYRNLDLLMRRRKPPELALPRRLLRELIAARTGHGNFAAYHRRFNFLDAPMECACGEETTPTHFIHCRLHANITRRLRKSTPHNDFIQKLLGPKCLKSFISFAQETGCFESQPANSSTALSGDQRN